MKSTLLILAIAFISGCSTTKDSVAPKPDDAHQTPPSHTSQNSLDWDGVYRGELPCADCEGLLTTVYLNKDMSFTRKTTYLGKSDSVFIESGTFTWNAQGNTIALAPTGKTQSTQYFVGENTLTQLDLEGNKIAGMFANAYILSKSRYAILEKYWKLVELNGKPVAVDSTLTKEPHLIFKEAGNRVIGNSGCNSFSLTFTTGHGERISINQGTITQMACPQMNFEREFLDALRRADNYNLVGDALVLNKARMAPLARFKIVPTK